MKDEDEAVKFELKCSKVGLLESWRHLKCWTVVYSGNGAAERARARSRPPIS
jgi:hypothetical protein